MIQVEHRAYQRYQREDDHHTAYHLINNKNAIGIKLAAYLVDEPGKTKPPQQGAKHDAEIAHAHLDRHVGNHKGKLRICGHEEEHDERIGEGDEKGRQAVVEQCALLVAALVHILHRVALETIHSEDKQQQTARNLKIELVLGIVDKIHHKAHTQTREHGIHDVAASSADACHKTIPAPLVQRALNTQNTYWTHGGRGNDTYDNTLENKIKDVYLYWKQ